MEVKHWEKTNSDMALYEANQEFESQRVQLQQANRWADQAQSDKISLYGEWELRNKIFQESQAKDCQEIEELSRNCCEETDRDRQASIDELSMHQERNPTTVSQLLSQVQDLQNKVNSLSDAKEFYHMRRCKPLPLFANSLWERARHRQECSPVCPVILTFRTAYSSARRCSSRTGAPTLWSFRQRRWCGQTGLRRRHPLRHKLQGRSRQGLRCGKVHVSMTVSIRLGRTSNCSRRHPRLSHVGAHAVGSHLRAQDLRGMQGEDVHKKWPYTIKRTCSSGRTCRPRTSLEDFHGAYDAQKIRERHA